MKAVTARLAPRSRRSVTNSIRRLPEYVHRRFERQEAGEVVSPQVPGRRYAPCRLPPAEHKMYRKARLHRVMTPQAQSRPPPRSVAHATETLHLIQRRLDEPTMPYARGIFHAPRACCIERKPEGLLSARRLHVAASIAEKDRCRLPEPLATSSMYAPPAGHYLERERKRRALFSHRKKALGRRRRLMFA